MSDEAMGDEVYQPTEIDDRGNPPDVDPDNSLGEKDLDETLDEGYSPPEKPLAVNDNGTTASGRRDGETLDQRLAEEVPDVQVPEGNGIGDQPGMAGEPLDHEISGEERAGRLTRSEGSARRADAVVAEDVGIDGGAASAEEAAMHVAGDEREEAAERRTGGS